jgi:hypothetical protein
MQNGARTKTYDTNGDGASLTDLLVGYRFVVSADARDARAALDVRRRVYVEASGYGIPVPDEYDRRSWLLLARERASGEAVASVRITPRAAGPLEAEEYFTLPAPLRSPGAAEISRLAILPAHRKSRTFLPVVSLGLFKLVMRFLQRIDARYMVICSRPERLWTFEWMRFRRTGLVAPYVKLGNAVHELMWYDFRRAAEILEGHPFRDFFVELEYAEVEVPAHAPALGVPIEPARPRGRLGQSA